tara:strand:+ start:11812 stop:13107 length:1296 start_codon:yes stop_codon:yes gene_type:complete
VSDPHTLKKVLVVISSDLIEPNSPRESRLISRALKLAKASGCELEFFHVCHDPSLEQGMFQPDPAVTAEKQRVTNQEAALLAEMLVRLQSEGVTVHQDVRWDHPRTDAILRKIQDSQPDLVMKESRDHNYLMGLTRNTDWDLIRQSPTNVWFVSSGRSNIANVMTAVGMTSDNEDPFTAADYDVFRTAETFAGELKAANHAVHVYQVPSGMGLYAAYAPDMIAAISTPALNARLERERKEVAVLHGQSIRRFAETLGIHTDGIRVIEGHPSDAIPDVAQELDADLIVMGARSLTRWERLVRPVTAEPVLADTSCDILFVKDDAETKIPLPDERPLRGSVPADLEKALTDPPAFFGSPSSVAKHQEFSPALRRRILQMWEQDVRARMREEGEGGPVRTTLADVLNEINQAKIGLACDEPADESSDRTLAAVG